MTITRVRGEFGVKLASNKPWMVCNFNNFNNFIGDNLNGSSSNAESLQLLKFQLQSYIQKRLSAVVFNENQGMNHGNMSSMGHHSHHSNMEDYDYNVHTQRNQGR